MVSMLFLKRSTQITGYALKTLLPTVPPTIIFFSGVAQKPPRVSAEQTEKLQSLSLGGLNGQARSRVAKAVLRAFNKKPLPDPAGVMDGINTCLCGVLWADSSPCNKRVYPTRGGTALRFPCRTGRRSPGTFAWGNCRNHHDLHPAGCSSLQLCKRGTFGVRSESLFPDKRPVRFP